MGANAPMMASVARVARSTSASNQRSRIGRAAPVTNSVASGSESPKWPRARYNLQSFDVSRRRFANPMLRHSFGRGSMSGADWFKIGSRTSAIFSSQWLYSGYRSASRRLNCAIWSWDARRSGPSRSDRPSSKGVNEEGLRGRMASPCCFSRRSRTISGRNKLIT